MATPLKDALMMIAAGFSFALLGLLDIVLAGLEHKPVFEFLQWICIAAFVVFTLAGVARILVEVTRVRRVNR